MNDLTLIIKDLSEFGQVYLHGVHQVLEDDSDAAEALHKAERDNFDRIFVYVDGWDSGEFDVYEVGSMLWNFPVKPTPDRRINKLKKDICRAVTTKQYASLTTYQGTRGARSFRNFFERALKVSKKSSTRDMAFLGLKYCMIYGW